MKKVNVVFIGECIVILALLLVIGGLLMPAEDRVAIAKEPEASEAAGEAESPEAQEVLVRYAAELLEEQQGSVSENDASAGEGVWENTAGTQEGEAGTVSGNGTAAAGGLAGADVVVFGDSIWNAGRGADGIAEHLQDELGVRVHNCAIGGTEAAVVSGSTNVLEGWDSRTLNGMVYIARGELAAEAVLQEEEALEIIQGVDFQEAEYLILSYGLNDFFMQVPVYAQDMYDMTTYVGALRHGIAKMRESYPQLKIILLSPTYTNWFADSDREGLAAYVQAAEEVAEEMGVAYLDMYHGLGIEESNLERYTEDGVHLNAEGTDLYAAKVAELLRGLEI